MNRRVVTSGAAVLPALVGLSLACAGSAANAAQPAPADPPRPGQTPTPPAVPPGGGGQGEAAGKGRLRYEHGVDRKSWFWAPQREEEVGAGPASQGARVPNPQRPDTLPVAVENGEATKESAVRFDLVAHGIPAGSSVTRFVLTVAEGTEPGEVPTLNPQNRRIYACAAGSFWADGEAETWDTRPDVSDTCVTGTRRAAKGADSAGATWTFDLSTMATTWGEDPFANNGVVLTGVTGKGAESGETWQVNLKAPSPDDPVTPADEYEQTSGRMVALVAYDPPAGGGSVPPPTQGGNLPGGAPPPPGGAGPGGLGEPPGTPAGSTSEPAGAPKTAPTSATDPPFTPQIPWYVWALVPAAFLATAAVRGALAEQTSVTRPGGVIETIRGRNAVRWGADAEPESGLRARLARLLPFERGAR